MSDARRQRLLNLQKRERLKALLVRKFRMKYGTGGQVSKLINVAVEQFVQLRKVTEKDLQALERKVRAACRQLGAMPRGQKVNADTLLASVSRKQTQQGPTDISPSKTIVSEAQPSPEKQSARRALAVSQSAPGLGAAAATNNTLGSTGESVPEDWTLINRYQMTLIEKEKAKERQAAIEKRRRIQEELEAQIKVKAEQKFVAKGSDSEYIEYLSKQQVKWKEEDAIKAAKKKAVIDRDRAMLQKQVLDKRNRMLKEQEDKRVFEEKLLKRMKKELETVRKQELEAKIKDKKRLAEFLSGNAKVRAIKEERRKKLAEEDKIRMKEYAAMLLKQENARMQYFADMTKKQDKFLDLNVESRQEEFAEKARMERINLEYQLKKEREDKEQEKAAVRIRRKKDKDISDWIKGAMDFKEKKRAAEKARYSEINAIGKKLAAEAAKEEVARKQKELDKRARYKRELESQIQGRAHLYEKVGRQIRRKQTNMDSREWEINRALIEKIKTEAPDLLSPVTSPVKKGEDDEGYSSII